MEPESSAAKKDASRAYEDPPPAGKDPFRFRESSQPPEPESQGRDGEPSSADGDVFAPRTERETREMEARFPVPEAFGPAVEAHRPEMEEPWPVVEAISADPEPPEEH